MKILLITTMHDMARVSSSTQIMIYNLVSGLYHIGQEITMVPVVDEGENRENVEMNYTPITHEVRIVPSAISMTSKGLGSFQSMCANFIWSHRIFWYKASLKKVLAGNEHYDMILALLPNVEASYYAQAAHKVYPTAKYVQFWSDPYCRSNLASCDPVPLKRLPLKIMEKGILKQADDIVYGTETLYQTQSALFEKLKRKMRQCDVSYNIFGSKNEKKIEFPKKDCISGYVGNYYTGIRNIEPCYKAFTENLSLGNLIVCGAGDIDLKESKNVKVMTRRAPLEATAIENGLDILICLLNSRTSQIPGKIFYQTNSGKPIIVILDGPDRKQIHEYLKKFNRFEFCENNEQSISECISRVKSGLYTASLETPLMLSPEAFGNSVIGK